MSCAATLTRLAMLGSRVRGRDGDFASMLGVATAVACKRRRALQGW